jgi:hypothetical protein
MAKPTEPSAFEETPLTGNERLLLSVFRALPEALQKKTLDFVQTVGEVLQTAQSAAKPALTKAEYRLRPTSDALSAEPPSIEPPSIEPPSIEPPSIEPPSIEPPSIEPPKQHKRRSPPPLPPRKVAQPAESAAGLAEPPAVQPPPEPLATQPSSPAPESAAGENATGPTFKAVPTLDHGFVQIKVLPELHGGLASFRSADELEQLEVPLDLIPDSCCQLDQLAIARVGADSLLLEIELGSKFKKGDRVVANVGERTMVAIFGSQRKDHITVTLEGESEPQRFDVDECLLWAKVIARFDVGECAAWAKVISHLD